MHEWKFIWWTSEVKLYKLHKVWKSSENWTSVREKTVRVQFNSEMRKQTKLCCSDDCFSLRFRTSLLSYWHLHQQHINTTADPPVHVLALYMNTFSSCSGVMCDLVFLIRSAVIFREWKRGSSDWFQQQVCFLWPPGRNHFTRLLCSPADRIDS